MTRSFFSTYRMGFLASALGLAVVIVAVIQIGQPANVPLLERLQTWGIFALVGLGTTVVGFGMMNVGAVSTGDGYASLDPARFAEDAPEQVDETARAEIVAASTEETDQIDRTPRCIACGIENRIDAKFCDQCGERL